jgi:ACS family hexuronate transporter-like MFS transporter
VARVEPRIELDDEVGAPAKAANRWAWGICWLMFASTVLNYMDRQALALVGTQIKGEFKLSNLDFGWVLAAFSMSYALFQVPAGYLVDRSNVRWTYAGAVAWWSAAGMAAAFSPSLAALMVLRAVLGMGESFNWPCALRVTGTILPPADRSLGNGIFNSGAAVGAVVAPLIVTPVAHRYGWRTAFFIVGCLGFAWVVLWLVSVRGRPAQAFAGRRRTVADSTAPVAELSGRAKLAFGGLLAASVLLGLSALRVGLSAIWFAIALFMTGLLVTALLLPRDALRGADWTESLGAIVRVRRFWILMIVTISINVCWHFLLNWLPTYIKEDLKPPQWLLSWFAVPLANILSQVWRAPVDPTLVGFTLLVTMPFVAADIGNLLGGILSRHLAARGLTPVQSRLAVMGLCTFIVSSGAWVGKASNAYLAIYLLSLMAMGTAAFMANYFSFAQEASAEHTGLIVGILGAFGNLFAAGFLPFAGAVKDRTGGFAPVFVLVGLMPFVGLIALLLGWGELRGRTDAKSS